MSSIVNNMIREKIGSSSSPEVKGDLATIVNLAGKGLAVAGIIAGLSTAFLGAKLLSMSKSDRDHLFCNGLEKPILSVGLAVAAISAYVISKL